MTIDRFYMTGLAMCDAIQSVIYSGRVKGNTTRQGLWRSKKRKKNNDDDEEEKGEGKPD